MGTIQHEALIVTSWSAEKLQAAHASAVEIAGDRVSPIGPVQVNGYRSFFVAPCGSKVGWDELTEHIADLNRIVTMLRSHSYEDGSSSFDWVRVEYGELGALVLDTHRDVDTPASGGEREE